MSTQHPITPPPELAEQWANDRPLLGAARRPKPPSLKEQALARLAELESDEPGYGAGIATIRRALEALPND